MNHTNQIVLFAHGNSCRHSGVEVTKFGNSCEFF